MRAKHGAIVALLFIATCSEETQEPTSPGITARQALIGKVAPSEVATWQKVGSSTSTPDGRYLQAGAFDEARKVFVMFGGEITDLNTGVTAPSQETWEWSPTTGKWTNRTGAGTTPAARSGAAMVFDSQRNKFLLFGGRAGSGFDYEDTWEWDPTTASWTDVTNAGSHPSAREQHAMVYEKSTGRVVLFGGGRSDANYSDGTGIAVSLGDTWEWDATTHVWTALSVSSGPSARHDPGMVWDSVRNKVVLFAGMQKDTAGVDGTPKQDTWEWDPKAATWTERTTQGDKPSARYAHAMAFDGSRGKAVVFGGWDIGTGGSKSDLWDWDPTSGTWTQRLTGSESGLPSARMYASLVSDDARARLELVAGYAPYSSTGTGGMTGAGGSIIYVPGPVFGSVGSKEVWELEPLKPWFTDRTAPRTTPPARTGHAMAYNSATAKVYLFGGTDMFSQPLDDLWEWDGKVWTEMVSDTRPAARVDAALAYDPVRKSLILFGGQAYSMYSSQNIFNDTWEWTSNSKWTPLKISTSPDPLYGHGMVTDTANNKILLFGGISNSTYVSTRGDAAGYKSPIRNEVWEWDGGKMTWTNRTPTALTTAPAARQYPVLAYDEARQKLFLYDGYTYGVGSATAFWEWDPSSAGWAQRDSLDKLNGGKSFHIAYDATRRREIMLTDAYNASTGSPETWELDSSTMTWYVRTLTPTPNANGSGPMAFDRARGVVVMFGGYNNGSISDETWEYGVTGLSNGEGCTAASAPSCASGNCVDGVCCASASCSGPCQSCNVSGKEGSCVAAQAGTEVPGSCADGQACDGSGNCKSSNGQACSSAGICASGHCVDGVCCDTACTGTCVSCLAGHAGTCSPHAAGSDPENECGKGTGVCRSTCDGVGACAFPSTSTPCASCTSCDGMGSCTTYDPTCSFRGGAGGSITGYGGSGGYRTSSYGGSGGYGTSYAGSGGYSTSYGVSGGSRVSFGGSSGTYPSGGMPVTGGYRTSYGGNGGYPTASGGSSGGYAASVGGRLGAGGSSDSAGSSGSGGRRDGGVGTGGNEGTATGTFSNTAHLHSTGCACEIGQANSGRTPGRLGMFPAIFAFAAALLLRRTRRR